MLLRPNIELLSQIEERDKQFLRYRAILYILHMITTSIQLLFRKINKI